MNRRVPFGPVGWIVENTRTHDARRTSTPLPGPWGAPDATCRTGNVWSADDNRGPYQGWLKGPVNRPDAMRGHVKIRADSPLYRGISVSLSGSTRWPCVYDQSSGWVVIGNPNAAITFVEFVSGAVLGLDGINSLQALWLQAGRGLQ